MPGESTDEGPDPASLSRDEPQPVPGPRNTRRRRAVLVVGGALVVVAGIVTVLVTFFQTTFLTNDDAAMAAIANGSYTGNRSSALVVAPPMFGNVLRLGYVLLPHLPWYGIALYTLQIVAWAMIAITVFVLRRRPPLLERIVVAAVFCALVPWMILRVSFTPTSLLVGVAGIIVFAAGATVRGRVGVLYAVGAGALLGVVDLVRTSSFLAVIVVFAPVIAIIAFKAGVRRTAVFALTAVVFVLVGFGTTKLEYSRSSQWSAFISMNSARGSLHDTPRLYSQNVSNSDLQKIGWTRNDLALFADFLYPDPTVYTDHDIRELAHLSPPVRGDMSASHVFDVLRDSSDERTNEQGPTVASLVLVAAILALRRNRTVAIVTLVSIVWAVGVLIALLLYVRLPGRVLIPLEGGAIFIAAVVPAYLMPSRGPTRPRGSWTSKVALVVVVLLAAGPAWHGVRSTSRISRQNESGIDASRTTLARLEAFDPNGVFVGRGDLIGRWAQPLSNTSPFSNPRLIPLGWATNSPLFTARLARAGISDLYTSLRSNSHVYLLGFKADAIRIAVFYKQHRTETVGFAPKVLALTVYFGAIPHLVTVWSTVTKPAVSKPAP